MRIRIRSCLDLQVISAHLSSSQFISTHLTTIHYYSATLTHKSHYYSQLISLLFTIHLNSSQVIFESKRLIVSPKPPLCPSFFNKLLHPYKVMPWLTCHHNQPQIVPFMATQTSNVHLPSPT